MLVVHSFAHLGHDHGFPVLSTILVKGPLLEDIQWPCSWKTCHLVLFHLISFWIYTVFGSNCKMQNLYSSQTIWKKVMKFSVNIGNMWRFLYVKAQIIVLKRWRAKKYWKKTHLLSRLIFPHFLWKELFLSAWNCFAFQQKLLDLFSMTHVKLCIIYLLHILRKNSTSQKKI